MKLLTFELLYRLWVILVLVRVPLQSSFPVQQLSSASRYQDEFGGIMNIPVGFLDLILSCRRTNA